jgi:hypothetical protein
MLTVELLEDLRGLREVQCHPSSPEFLVMILPFIVVVGPP